LGLSHIIALISWNNNVCTFNNTLESLVHCLSISLKFKDSTINFVDKKDRLNFFGKSLTKHSFSLNANTFDVVDDD
jgi:hypothetical protein